MNGIQFAYDVQGSGAFSSTKFFLDGVTLTYAYTDSSNRTLALSALSPTLAAGTTVSGATLNIAHSETGVAREPAARAQRPNITGRGRVQHDCPHDAAPCSPPTRSTS